MTQFPSNCARCGADLKQAGSIVSKFNLDTLCLACKDDERQSPNYRKADDAECAAVQAGNDNFAGVGLAPEDREFLRLLSEPWRFRATWFNDMMGVSSRSERGYAVQPDHHRVAGVIAECSDTDQVPKPPWRERKEAYLAHLRTASADARLVSAADKLNNLRNILADYRQLGEDLWGRFNAKREDQLWFYRSVISALRDAGSNPSWMTWRTCFISWRGW